MAADLVVREFNKRKPDPGDCLRNAISEWRTQFFRGGKTGGKQALRGTNGQVMADVNHVLKKVFEEELSVIWDSIGPRDRFKEILGLDNIDLGIMLCQLELDLGIELPDDFLQDIDTVEQLRNELIVRTSTVH